MCAYVCLMLSLLECSSANMCESKCLYAFVLMFLSLKMLRFLTLFQHITTNTLMLNY